MTRVTISDDVELHVEEFGSSDAPAVLLIRGTGADSSRWMPQVEAYRDEFHVVIFDNRGVGRSSTPPGPYTVAEMANDSRMVLDALGIETCHVSGSSLGGAIALQMAVDTPSRVLSLQLHSSWLATRGYTAYSLGLLKTILELGGTHFYYEATLPLLFTASFLSSDFERTTEMLARMRENTATPEGLFGQIAANISHDLSAHVGGISVPTLITVGEHDLLLPVAASEELHQCIAGSELVVFEGVGHLASMEAAPRFNAVTLEWMRSVVASTHA
jgi:pimeloyl-ACP methyl ester carboxylesterase